MYHFFIKIFIVFGFLSTISNSTAQQLTVSEPINIFRDESYAFSAKINDRYLFFSWHEAYLSVNSLDNGLRSIWQKDITIDKKYDVKILDVIPSKLSFCVIARMRKKGNNFIKVLKFDGQAKLLDSSTVCIWKTQLNEPEIETFISDDKRVMFPQPAQQPGFRRATHPL